MKKNIFLNLITVAVLLAAVSVFVACGGTGKNNSRGKLEYSLNEDGASYTVVGKGKFNGEELIIPEEYKGKPVTAIGSGAFSGCKALQTVLLPETLTTIDDRAFSDCVMLGKVYIPASVTFVGDGAFGYYCGEDDNGYLLIDDFAIYGNEGTAAEEYACKNDIAFYRYSAYAPNKEGDFWHYSDGEIVVWEVSLEHFTGVEFTGETQMGRSLDHDFDEEDESYIENILEETTALIKEGEDFDAFWQNNIEIYDLKNKLETAIEYCSYEFYMYGTSDIRDRLDRLEDLLLEMEKWRNGLQRELYNSAFKSTYFGDATDEEIEALLEGDAPDEYYEYQAQMNDVLSEYSMTDYYDMDNFERIEELYVSFVESAQYLAEYNGYDNYLEYLYQNSFGRSYDVALTDGFFELVVEYVIPAYYETRDAFHNDYAALSASDKAIVDEFLRGDAFLRGFDEFYAYEKTIGGDYEEAFDELWREDGAFFISYDNYYGAFTGYYPGSYDPCVYFSDGLHDIMTIVHEFGHYYDFTYSGSCDYDLSETQSQGNELLYLAFLKNSGFYSDSVIKVIFEDKMRGYLQSVVLSSAVNEFEKMVYDDDDFTFGEARGYVDEIIERMGLENDDFGVWSYWHVVAVDCAGYYISYATSLIGAFNIYKLASTDFDAAVEAYKKLVDYWEYDIPDDIRSVYEYAGLKDVFTEDAFIYFFGE